MAILCAYDAQDNSRHHIFIDHSMRLVLDTNIVMDMLHFADRYTQPLQTAIGKGEMQCFTDTLCFAELERVAAYPEFRLEAQARKALVENYRSFVKLVDARAEENYRLPRCRDEDDQKFLVLAARCQADLLITRDKQLLELSGQRHKPPPCPIVTAEAACQLLGLG